MENHLQIEKASGELENFQAEKTLNSLVQANFSAGEKNFSAYSILEKTLKYLEIFLDSAAEEKKISSEKFKNLLVKVLQENNFPETANYFLNFHNQNESEKVYFTPAANNLISKIYAKNDDLKALNSEQIFEKIANLSTDKDLSKEIIKLILEQKFLPPHNLHKDKLKEDYVNLTIEDDLNEIFNALKQFAFNFQNLIQTNLNFSNLRPKNSLIKSNLGSSSGPISFMQIFIATFETLKLGLSQQPYLNQKIILNIHHPDILEFLIFIKNQQKHSTNKNINYLVEITPQFIDALSKKADFELINPQNQETVNFLSSSNIFDLILSTIKENPQLGIILNEKDLFQKNQYFLSSAINLTNYIEQGEFNFENLKNNLKLIDEFFNKIPLTRHLKLQINFLGLFSSIEKLNIPLNSIQSLEFIENTSKFIQENLPENLLAIINFNSLQKEIFNLEDNFELIKNNLNPELILKIQKTLEKNFKNIIDQQIYIPIDFDFDNLKQVLLENFQSGIISFNHVQFEQLNSGQFETESNHGNKNLFKIYSNRRSKTKEIQPPLFKIKKTEEISLPPIENS